MAKFTLEALGNPNDPFGYVPEQAVEIVDRSPAPGSFRFAQDSFLPAKAANFDRSDPFGDGMPLSPAAKAMKITLPQVDRDDPFLSALKPQVYGSSRGSRVHKSVDGFKFDKAAPAIWDEVGLGDIVEDAPFTKGAAGGFSKFQQFTKVKETGDGDIEVWGIATHEKPDLDGEVCDYFSARDAYRKWSAASATRTAAAGQQISLGPIRHQHSTKPAGKATRIEYNDDDREIWLGSVPIDDDIRQQLQQGFLTGYSQGGSYAWRECADCGKSLSLQQANNFCPGCNKNSQVRFGLKRLSEVSYVDSPCTGQGFDYVRADGSSKFVSFAKRAPRSNGSAAQVLSNKPVAPGVWKSVVVVDGIRHAVLHWPGGWMFAA